jgi:hypothetical protein
MMKLLFSTTLAVLTLFGCTKEAPARTPTELNISISTFNYADQSVVNVTVNGKPAGNADRPKKGEVTDGGTLCCVALSPRKGSATVVVTLADGSKYTTEAKIRMPLPEVASYAVVHLLPGQRALIEVFPTTPFNDIERLPELLKALEK